LERGKIMRGAGAPLADALPLRINPSWSPVLREKDITRRLIGITGGGFRRDYTNSY
jgi:hypothetical protein